MDRAVEDARKGIDWSELKKDELLFLSERPYFVKKKSIEKFFEDENDKNK